MYNTLEDGLSLGLGPPRPPTPEQLPPAPAPQQLQQPPPSSTLPLLQFLDTSSPPSPPTRCDCPNPTGPTDRPAGDPPDVPSSSLTAAGPSNRPRRRAALPLPPTPEQLPPPPPPSPTLPLLLQLDHTSSAPPSPPTGPTGCPAGDPTDVPSSSSTAAGPSNRPRRRAALQASERIDPPFPWATDRPAHIHPIAYLADNGRLSVVGETQCGDCGRNERVTYNVRDKLREILSFISSHMDDINDRAPDEWMKPAFPDCSDCGKEMKPVVDENGEKVNWLFLFLGQTLGICKLDLLKWYCKQHGIHCTGAKNRVLYSSYISICSQLRPDIPQLQGLLRYEN